MSCSKIATCLTALQLSLGTSALLVQPSTARSAVRELAVDMRTHCPQLLGGTRERAARSSPPGMQLDCPPPPGFVCSTWEEEAAATVAGAEVAKPSAEAKAKAETDTVGAEASAEPGTEVAAASVLAAAAAAAAATEAFATEAAATEAAVGTFEEDECAAPSAGATPLAGAESSSGAESASELKTGNSADFFNSGGDHAYASLQP